jgi:hypothetical protein
LRLRCTKRCTPFHRPPSAASCRPPLNRRARGLLLLPEAVGCPVQHLVSSWWLALVAHWLENHGTKEHLKPALAIICWQLLKRLERIVCRLFLLAKLCIGYWAYWVYWVYWLFYKASCLLYIVYCLLVYCLLSIVY